MAKNKILTFWGCIGLILFSSARTAFSDELVKSRILVIMDTSGSMQWAVHSNRRADRTGGDGVPSILGMNSAGNYDVRLNRNALWFDQFEGFDSLVDTDGRLNNSRMFVAKQALRSVVENYPGIEFSLMRFPQRRERVCATQCISSQFTGPIFDPVNNPVHEQIVNRVSRCTHLQNITDAADNGCFDDEQRRAENNGPYCPGYPSGLYVHESLQTLNDLDTYSNYQTPGSVLCGTRYRPIEDNWCPEVVGPYPPHGDLLVGFPGTACTNEAGQQVPCWPEDQDNRDGIVKWINNREPIVEGGVGDHGRVFDDGLGHQMGDFCSHSEQGDCELRARGGTPIAGSLLAAGEYMSDVIAADTKNACRPYSIILLTDGEETCDGNPVNVAQRIYDGDGNFPGNVKVYVIGLSLLTEDNQGDQNVIDAVQSLNDIAREGGTGQSFPASNLVEISSAFSKIIQDSLLVETCNGQDDDCDSNVDEGFSLYCNSKGLIEDGQGSPILGTGSEYRWGGETVNEKVLCYELPESRCDGEDDDCDGEIDEGLLNECGQCMDDVFEEICGNLADDDCDGAIDEDCERCLLTEICNSPNPLDDDCDGVIDEGLGIGDACEIGEGRCLNQGRLECSLDGTVVCNASPQEPNEEICNGEDDDCDGEIDEGRSGGPYLEQSCYQGRIDSDSVGLCRRGIQYCLNGQFQGQCFGQIMPVPDDCDGQDNDCDGRIDEESQRYSEEFSCPFECQTVTCNEEGSIQCVNSHMDQDEICDGIDNDCDGNFDEIDVQTCGESNVGTCRLGFLSCHGIEDAPPLCVGAITPVNEICDGLDNDCDENSDEGFSVGSRCKINNQMEIEINPRGCGLIRCDLNGGVFCDLPQEICDGLDNDCDGQVDEDPQSICDEETVCIEGQCASECQVEAEFGITLCPGNHFKRQQNDRCFCLRSECSPSECALETQADPQDLNRILCAPDQAGMLPCLCKEGSCSHVCEDVICEEGFRCDPSNVEGNCVPACSLTGCGEEDFCHPISGQCEQHPCANVSCEEGQVCKNGKCKSSCAFIECEEDETCDNGKCNQNLCVGIDCPGSQLCNPESGQCERGCLESCSNGTECDPSTKTCVLDACLITVCPNGQFCEKGNCFETINPVDDIDSDRRIEKRVFASGGCSIQKVSHQSDSSQNFFVALVLLCLGFTHKKRTVFKK